MKSTPLQTFHIVVYPKVIIMGVLECQVFSNPSGVYIWVNLFYLMKLCTLFRLVLLSNCLFALYKSQECCSMTNLFSLFMVSFWEWSDYD